MFILTYELIDCIYDTKSKLFIMNDVYRLSIVFFLFFDKKGEIHSTKEQN